MSSCYFKYRPDIDGLRAVAVMLVLAYHFGVPGFASGFIGVDVFFVISGYLITKILLGEIDRTGRVSYAKFFLRRSKRILPALLVTIFFTISFGFFLFTPDRLMQAAESGLAAIFSFSNIYFWLKSGYFDAEAIYKPLLHTWSLGVEEQFYLLWPFLLMAAFSKGSRGGWILLGGFAVFSLVISEITLRFDDSAAFYLSPFRAYEFFIGALVILIERASIHENIKKIFWIFGFLFLGFSILFIDGDSAFPGFTALLPAVSAGFIIIGGTTNWAAFLLNRPYFLFIGTISYSLYLVHWPVYVFYTEIIGGNELIDQAFLFLISIILASALYKFVECPTKADSSFWNYNGKLKFHNFGGVKLVFFILLFISASPSLLAIGTNGGLWRLPGNLQEIISNRDYFIQETKKFIPDSNKPFNEGKLGLKVLVIGDSHSRDLYNAFYLSGIYDEKIQLRRVLLDEECLYKIYDKSPPHDLKSNRINYCENSFEEFHNDPNVKNADVIIYAAKWHLLSTLPYISDLVGYVNENSDARIIFMTRKIDFVQNVPDLLFKYGSFVDFDKYLGRSIKSEVDIINASLVSGFEKSRLNFYDYRNIQCDFVLGKCEGLNSDGKLLYWDSHHWTLEGAVFFGNLLLNNKEFTSLLFKNNI